MSVSTKNREKFAALEREVVDLSVTLYKLNNGHVHFEPTRSDFMNAEQKLDAAIRAWVQLKEETS